MSIAHLGLAPEPQPPREGWQGERTPPHDLLAEQSAIGGMLLSKDAVADVLEAVRAVDFYVPKHEYIFDAILTLYSHGEPTDVIAVTDELTKTGNLQRAGGPEYLHTLTGLVPTAANAGYYASIVAEKAVVTQVAGKPSRAQFSGGVTLQQEMDDGDHIDARSASVDYDMRSEVIVFTGNVNISQQRGSLSGERVVYNLKTGQLESGGGTTGGRVKMRILPKGTQGSGKGSP